MGAILVALVWQEIQMLDDDKYPILRFLSHGPIRMAWITVVVHTIWRIREFCGGHMSSKVADILSSLMLTCQMLMVLFLGAGLRALEIGGPRAELPKQTDNAAVWCVLMACV